MRVHATSVADVWVVEQEPAYDERGWFVRTFDRVALQDAGLIAAVDTVAVSHNAHAHTLRGMHYQRAPHEETKLVRCSEGRIFDVAVDLRPDSPTYLQWFGTELDDASYRMLYVPPGCAHGFLTLTERSEVTYYLAGTYAPAAAAGVRWDDEAIGIEWPAAPAVISERDAGYPLLSTRATTD